MKVVHATIFTNGMVMAFNDKGEQMSDCQGFILDEHVRKNLVESCDKDTKFDFGDWTNKTGMSANFGWWWKDSKKGKNK